MVAISACGGHGEGGSWHDTALGRLLPTWNEPFSPGNWEPLVAFPESEFVAACHHHWVLPAQYPGRSHQPGVGAQESVKLEQAAAASALVVMLLEAVAHTEH